MGKLITFQRPDGQTCNGYAVESNTSQNVPGIILLQEWWGLNNQIKREADRLAAAGYRVIVPDLYQGEITLDAAEAEHLMNRLDFSDATLQNIRGAAQQFKSPNLKLAVMGFCMGGTLAILTAVHVPEVDVAVCWYGIPPEDAGDTRTISIPVQGHFAQHDSYCPTDAVDALESRFKEGGVNYEFYRYDAHHAFGNADRDIYDPEAAKLAWTRSLTFLSTHLKQGCES